MFPIGKFTLSIIGLRLFSGYGFLWGMFLGHMLIDRTILRKIIKQYISTIDDNIRIMLPYKYYRYYSRIENSIFGILYGSLLGAITFGFPGFIVFFLLGHLFFDLPDNQNFSRFRSFFETFWNQHWGKILGVLIGLSLRNNWIIVIGVVLGFILDYYRFKGLETPQKLSIFKQFWLKLNLLKLYLHSKEARKFALIQAMTGLSAKVAKADGQVTENEIRTFKKLFELDNDSDSKVKDIFNYNKNSTIGYEKYAKQLSLITQNNLELKENIIENLFKIASADGSPCSEQLDILRKTAQIIDLPEGNFELIENNYTIKTNTSTSPLQNYYEILGISATAGDSEIKARWKELILQYHPDHAAAQGASAEEIEIFTAKMAAINDAYQKIKKSRKI